jgi:hypothetical protein
MRTELASGFGLLRPGLCLSGGPIGGGGGDGFVGERHCSPMVADAPGRIVIQDKGRFAC